MKGKTVSFAEISSSLSSISCENTDRSNPTDLDGSDPSIQSFPAVMGTSSLANETQSSSVIKKTTSSSGSSQIHSFSSHSIKKSKPASEHAMIPLNSRDLFAVRKKEAEDAIRRLQEVEQLIKENGQEPPAEATGKSSDSELELDMTTGSPTSNPPSNVSFVSVSDSVLPAHITSTQNDDQDMKSNVKAKHVECVIVLLNC